MNGKVASAATATKKPTRKTVTIASRKIKLASGKRGKINVKLSKAGLSLLKQAKDHKLRVSAIVKAGKATKKAPLTLKFAKAAKLKG